MTVSGGILGGPVRYDLNAASASDGIGHKAGYRPNFPMDMLAMRMRWSDMLAPPFDHISIHWRADHPKAYVFLVHKLEAVTLEDDATLFPSDQLISQLRLLLG